MFSDLEIDSVTSRFDNGTTLSGSGIFLYLFSVDLVFLLIMTLCLVFYILTRSKEGLLKVKVKMLEFL